MISNERQHRITTSQIKRFEEAIWRAEKAGPAADVHPRLHGAMIEGMRSQLKDLQGEVSEYEALREGKIRQRVFHSLLEIPTALVEGRIARRLTQKQLAEKLGVPEQQVQRYERTGYSGVGVDRLQEVADALEIKMTKTVEYDVHRPRAKHAATRVRNGSKPMAATRKPGKAAASAAGKTLASEPASPAAKKVAASDLSQVGNRKGTSKGAASAAGKNLASNGAGKTAKNAAASDLPQAARKKR